MFLEHLFLIWDLEMSENSEEKVLNALSKIGKHPGNKE